MRRYEANRPRDRQLDRVFSFLRGKGQGDPIRIRDHRTGEVIEVHFLRRGRVNVSVSHPATGQTELVPLERVIVS